MVHKTESYLGSVSLCPNKTGASNEFHGRSLCTEYSDWRTVM